MNELMERLPIVSYDIVEFNSEYDVKSSTAEFVKKLAHKILSNG